MYTCFLFAERLDEAHCYSLRLDESGKLDAPLVQRTVEEFRALQKGAQTIVVLPTRVGSLHELELPKLSDSKARAAIPYVLEEQLAESVTGLHFALMRQLGEGHRFLIAVFNKQWVAEFIHHLATLEIAFDEITLDWFALAEGEACVHGHYLLIHDPTFKGAVGIELMPYTLKAQRMPLKIFTFSTSVPTIHPDTILLADNAYEWIAQRLLKHRFLNICQGEFSHDTKQRQTRRWFLFAGIAAGAWFVLSLLLKVILLLMLNHQISQIDAHIATVYRVFFPQAHVVVSPRFRIEQLLKQNQSGTDAILWRLLEQLPTAVFPEGGNVPNPSLQIQSLRYQSAGLIVSLECDDFATLESFENRLHHQRVTVRQLSAAQKGKHVVATLELK